MPSFIWCKTIQWADWSISLAYSILALCLTSLTYNNISILCKNRKMMERTGIFHHVCRIKYISPPQTAGGGSASFCHVLVHGQHQQIRTDRRRARAASCSRSNFSDVQSAVMAFLCRSAASLLKPYRAAPAVLSAARLYSSGVFVCLWFKLHRVCRGLVVAAAPTTATMSKTCVTVCATTSSLGQQFMCCWGVFFASQGLCLRSLDVRKCSQFC